jgi:hypothetical protein
VAVDRCELEEGVDPLKGDEVDPQGIEEVFEIDLEQGKGTRIVAGIPEDDSNFQIGACRRRPSSAREPNR